MAEITNWPDLLLIVASWVTEALGNWSARIAAAGTDYERQVLELQAQLATEKTRTYMFLGVAAAGLGLSFWYLRKQ